MILSRVISGKDVSDVRPWAIPDVEAVSPAEAEVFTSTGDKFNPDATRQQQQKQEFDGGYNDGFAKGYAEGKQAAEEELEHDRSHLEMMLNFLSHPVENLEQQVENELLELSIAIAKQILKREVSLEPMHLMGLIRTAVARLPASESEVTVQLNPDDAKIIRKALQKPENPQRWKIIEDPGLTPGSCNVNSDSSFVDGSIDAMVTQMSLDLFGGHRGGDRNRQQDQDEPEAQAAPTRPSAEASQTTSNASKPKTQPKQTQRPTPRSGARK